MTQARGLQGVVGSLCFRLLGGGSSAVISSLRAVRVEVLQAARAVGVFDAAGAQLGDPDGGRAALAPARFHYPYFRQDFAICGSNASTHLWGGLVCAGKALKPAVLERAPPPTPFQRISMAPRPGACRAVAPACTRTAHLRPHWRAPRTASGEVAARNSFRGAAAEGGAQQQLAPR
jgi:hypothetical protein